MYMIKNLYDNKLPYYTPHVADGLAFSSQISNYIPPSLENIYKEIESDIYNTEEKIERYSSLEYLAQQGVFLYNTALTVEIAMPASHIKNWVFFTERVLKELNNGKPIVVMLWGNYAKRYKKYFDDKKHFIIETTHPSPLSANKGGWFGEKPFSRANKFLKEIYGESSEINWGIRKTI